MSSTRTSSVRPRWPHSRSAMNRGRTPITRPPAASAPSASAPISPTAPPPQTIVVPSLASVRPSRAAASRNTPSVCRLDAQYTQTRSSIALPAYRREDSIGGFDVETRPPEPAVIGSAMSDPEALAAAIRALPKVELHQHVDGSIPPEVTWELMRHHRLNPVSTLDEMRRRLELQEDEEGTLLSYLDKMHYPLWITQFYENISRVTEAIVDAAAA